MFEKTIHQQMAIRDWKDIGCYFFYFFICIMYRTRQGTYKNCKTLPFRSIQSMDLERLDVIVTHCKFL